MLQKKAILVTDLQRIRKHIAIFLVVLLGIIVPKETWHIFADHTDTHCEFDTGTNISSEHTHCEMLQFETSSFESNINNDPGITNSVEFNYTVVEVLQYCSSLSIVNFLRGPPTSV